MFLFMFLSACQKHCDIELLSAADSPTILAACNADDGWDEAQTCGWHRSDQ